MQNRPLIYAISCLIFAAIPIVRSQHLAYKFKPVDLAYTATDGTQVDLASMRGKVVLIDFWATWCGPCMAEVPDVVSTYNQFHTKGLKVIGVSLDIDRARMDQITRERAMPWPQYFDGKAWDNNIATHFGIHSIPTMWLIDKNGMLADTDARENLHDKVANLLAR